ncbi:MAG: nitroreductase family deazaflavin-dependent oxidoreductase [Gammaproteobacteria bacterium]
MPANILDTTVAALDEGRLPDWISDHVRRYRETGGADGHLWDTTPVGGDGPRPCLLLTTRGRKSGREYTHPLLYAQDGEDYIIVASKGGSDEQPHWYFNLLAEPKVRVQVGPDEFAALARAADDADYPRLWALVTAMYPPYLDYQARTARRIPLFLLRRA